MVCNQSNRKIVMTRLRTLEILVVLKSRYFVFNGSYLVGYLSCAVCIYG